MKEANAKSNRHTAEENSIFRANLKDILASEPDIMQKDFASILEVEPTILSAVKNGRANASERLAVNLAAFAGIPVEMLYKKTPAERKAEEWFCYGRKISTARLKKGFDTEHVASLAGINHVAYEKIESGEIGASPETRKKIEKVLFASPKYARYVDEPMAKAAPPALKEKSEAKVVTQTTASISSEVIEIVLSHVTDLNVDRETQRKVFRAFSAYQTDMREAELFGKEVSCNDQM